MLGLMGFRDSKVSDVDEGLRIQMYTHMHMQIADNFLSKALIVWTEHDGTDMALSFQYSEGCEII